MSSERSTLDEEIGERGSDHDVSVVGDRGSGRDSNSEQRELALFSVLVNVEKNFVSHS